MVRWLTDIGRRDTEHVGTKAANLGTLFSDDADVPRGFCIDHETLESQLENAGISRRINRITRRLDRSDWSSVTEAANRIETIIDDAGFETSFRDEIEEAYENINLSQKVRNAGDKAVELVGGQRETDFVAVRPSSIEDGFARPQIGINGKDAVIDAIKDVLISAYSADALYHGDEGIPAILIQKMVDADISCTVYTQNPVTGDDEIVIEAVNGIGIGITRGDVEGDRYFIDRSTGRLNEKTVATKRQQYSKNPTTGSLEQQRVPRREREERICDSDMLSDIVNTALDLASKLDDPLRIDLSVGRNKTFILDAGTPTINTQTDNPAREDSPLLSGTTASGGQGNGTATLRIPEGLPEEGTIMVTDTSDLEPLSAITGAVGLITDTGLLGSWSARHARRHDTPMIIETGNGSRTLEDGQQVQLDGATGMIYGTNGPEQLQKDDTALDQVPATATKLFALGEDIPRADGRVTEHDDRVTISNGSGTLQASRNGTESRGQLVDDYAGVLTAKQAAQSGTDHIVLDIDQLGHDPAAITEAIATISHHASCSLLMRRPDTDALEAAVEHAVNAVIVPAEQFDETEKQLERIERRYLLDKIRETRDG